MLRREELKFATLLAMCALITCSCAPASAPVSPATDVLRPTDATASAHRHETPVADDAPSIATITLPIVATAVSTGTTWIARAPTLQARQEIAAVELGGKMYVVGGFGADRSTLTTAEVYDPLRDTWRPIAPMPLGLHHPMAAALDGRLYVVGGYVDIGFTPSNVTLAYDPTKDEWTRKADMPAPRGAGGAVALNGRLYVVGGERGGVSVGDLAAYDPDNDVWTVLAPMPTPRNHIGVAVISDRLYVVGGRDATSGTLTAFEVYDPATDQWQSLPPLPTGRSGHAAAVLHNCLYAIGGEGSNRPRGIFDENERFDPHTGKWEAAQPMPTGRHGIGAVALGDWIYVPAGADVQGFGAVSMHQAFRPAHSCGQVSRSLRDMH